MRGCTSSHKGESMRLSPANLFILKGLVCMWRVWRLPGVHWCGGGAHSEQTSDLLDDTLGALLQLQEAHQPAVGNSANGFVRRIDLFPARYVQCRAQIVRVAL